MTAADPKSDPMSVTTPPCRLGFPSLFIPSSYRDDPNARKTYNCVVLVPPDQAATVAAIKATLQVAATEKWGAKIPKLSGRQIPFKLCTGEYEGYDEGWTAFRAQSNGMPIVVDQARQPIFPLLPPTATEDDIERAAAVAERRIYGGCWCRFHLSAFVWDNKFGFGLGLNVAAVQLIRDDTAFGRRRVKAEEVFDAIDGFAAPEQPGPTANDLFG